MTGLHRGFGKLHLTDSDLKKWGFDPQFPPWVRSYSEAAAILLYRGFKDCVKMFLEPAPPTPPPPPLPALKLQLLYPNSYRVSFHNGREGGCTSPSFWAGFFCFCLKIPSFEASLAKFLEFTKMYGQYIYINIETFFLLFSLYLFFIFFTHMNNPALRFLQIPFTFEKTKCRFRLNFVEFWHFA